MMNDPLVHDLSDKLAVRVGLACADDAERIDYAYRLALGRSPTKEEVRMSEDYVKDCRGRLKEAGLPWDQLTRGSLASYMRVLFGSNEFVFVD